MSKPSGKLAYAYGTIRKMESIIEEQKEIIEKYERLKSLVNSLFDDCNTFGLCQIDHPLLDEFEEFFDNA